MGGQVQHHMIIAAMENVWDYQLFFLHSKPIPKER